MQLNMDILSLIQILYLGIHFSNKSQCSVFPLFYGNQFINFKQQFFFFSKDQSTYCLIQVSIISEDFSLYIQLQCKNILSYCGSQQKMFESHQLEKLIQVGTQTLRILIANSSQQQKIRRHISPPSKLVYTQKNDEFFLIHSCNEMLEDSTENQ